MHTYTRISKNLILSSALCGALFFGAYGAAIAASFTDAQKEELGTIIQDYLKENPEVVVDALDQFRANQLEAQKAEARENITANMEYFKSADVPVAGNPDGDILVVEFFDYNCGYCKRAYEDVLALTESNKNARIVLMEMPILGPTSLDAAKWAMAAKKQGKYFEYHQALMETKLPKNEATFIKLAKEVGLDADKMKTDAASESVMEEISKHTSIARSIGITGTPAFIIGTTLYPGSMDAAALKEAVELARS